MNWLEFSIKTTGQAVEAISEILTRFGATGVAINDPSDIIIKNNESIVWDYIDESLRVQVDFVYVKAYYPDIEDSKLKLDEIKKTIDGIKEYIDVGEGLIEIKTVCEEDWANEWKKYYKPIKVGTHLLIKPSWEDVDVNVDDVVIELDPGMAFGTGTHESTRMCMELLERHMKKGDEVFDIGCGSGILSIAAAKLGALMVDAIDIDPVAVKTSNENFSMNKIGKSISAKKAVIEEVEVQKYDVVLANIVADIIISISDRVKLFLKPEGKYIVSGIIKDRANDVRNKLVTAGFNIIEEKNDGEWVAIAATL